MDLSHVDKEGRPRMVDVGHKPLSHRSAKAEGFITLQPETIKKIKALDMQKGNVLTTAELAGVSAAKQTASLIPLCHNIFLSQVTVEAQLKSNSIQITAEAKCTGQTGVEMEALTAVNIALLTVYDMCKAVDKTMEIGGIRLLEKTKK